MATKTEKKSDVKEPFQVTRAKCVQCGHELRYVPFALKNIMCRKCYGLDRYRRETMTVVAVEKPVEIAVTEEQAAASN